MMVERLKEQQMRLRRKRRHRGIQANCHDDDSFNTIAADTTRSRRGIVFQYFSICLVIFSFSASVAAFPTQSSRKLPRGVLPQMIPNPHISSTSLERSGRLQPFLTIFRPLSFIWRSDVSSSSSFEDNEFNQERNATKLVLEAAALKAQAKVIMDQALAMERELKQSRSAARSSKRNEADRLLNLWFTFDDKSQLETTANITEVAYRLEHFKVSPQQILMVVDRIFELQMEAAGQTAYLEEGSKAHGTDDAEDLESNFVALQNETEYERLSDVMETLSLAVSLVDETVSKQTESGIVNTRWKLRVDSAMQARLNELRRTQKIKLDRKLAAVIYEVTETTTGSAEGRNIARQVLEGSRSNKSSADIVHQKMELVPLWVPAVFLPFIITSKESSLGPADVSELLDDVLMGSRFYVTSHQTVPGAAIFRGNIRVTGPKDDSSSKSEEQPTAAAFADISRRLEQRPNLADRVQLFFLPDPEWQPKTKDKGPEPKPVVLALSKDISPDESQLNQSAVFGFGKKALYLLVTMTTFRYGIEGYSLNRFFFNSVVKERSLQMLTRTCLPVVGGILGVQMLQQVIHFWVAKWRGIKIGLPIPIPSMEIGTFGCISPIRSFPPDRKSLLDFALSGPFVTALASIGCIVASVLLTVRASPETLMKFPVLPAMLIKSSFLVGTLTSWIASKVLMLPSAHPVPVHPLFLVGYASLITSGLNLLPVFRLNGGRACSAALGPRQAAVISVSALLLLLSLAISGGTGLGFTWGMIIALFQRQQEAPPRDDVTEVDNLKLCAWVFSILLSFAILAPFPGAPGIL